MYNIKFINEIFQHIWEDRYQKNGETLDGNIKRVAEYCAKDPDDAVKFSRIMREGKFFPGGRTMSNAGIGKSLTLNNCFVAPALEDSLEAIFSSVALGARTHQRGGGIGYDFSRLRPSGTPTSNDAVASGPVSFMDVFNAQTATILQGNRRGANMGVLNVYHPDILTFINAKSADSQRLCHFNLSVMVDDAFMRAVMNGDDVTLHWPVYDGISHIITDPSQWKITKTISAKYLWDEIMQRAYDNGEPGIMFYDTMNNGNPLQWTETITQTNPCNEYLAGLVFGQELPPDQYGGACNLGSLMLQNFVLNPFTPDAVIDMAELRSVIWIAVRMLDNIIDINVFPDKIYENYQKTFRTIGLGVTGLADALCMLGMKYDSSEAVEYVGRIMNDIAATAYEASIGLAMERGSFPAMDTEKYLQNGYLAAHNDQRWSDIKKHITNHGLRNSKILAIAPTGTMSLTFGNNCSSGIEPIFSLSYDRKVKVGSQDSADTKTVTVEDYAYSICPKDGSVDMSVFRTTQQISVDAHIEMLAAIAKHVDMSVSKTINVPTEYSFEQTKEIYLNAWRRGIKGCTIFRPNALRPGILTTEPSTKKPNPKHTQEPLGRGDIIDVCYSDVCRISKLTTGCGSLHVIAAFDPVTGDLLQTFFAKGSQGGCERNLTGLSRLVSIAARSGVPIQVIVDQLKSVGNCTAYTRRADAKHDTSPGTSCCTAIAIELMAMWQDVQEELFDVEPDAPMAPSTKDNGDKCPDCGEPIRVEGGCNVCPNCGWSKCG